MLRDLAFAIGGYLLIGHWTAVVLWAEALTGAQPEIRKNPFILCGIILFWPKVIYNSFSRGTSGKGSEGRG